MGIFEKSIPKYVVNPIDRTVEVAPQEVYVDDIFDPIFNANVRNAMRQKYGDGLYGITGGYGELLQNTWGGDKGLFGKGMGVLSTFGRSMEKADDIMLGLLTEGVEGLSGQGFDDPLKQIFVEDEDYTGKRFLASTANIFRNLAGGTTITEQDLGTAWNVPALGVELGTDVGILGGGLSRKLAPAARNFTSKELFQRLGKSDVKTTVGEIGQLMSNYDDLMSRVAIDITAPGLRPAFKKLGNKLAQWVATHSPKEFTDYEILKNNPEVRKAAKQHFDTDPVSQAVDTVSKTADEIPISNAEVAEQATKSEESKLIDILDNEALEWHKYLKEYLSNEEYAEVDKTLRDVLSSQSKEMSFAYDSYNKAFSEAVGKMLERMQARGIDISSIGLEQYSDELPSTISSIQDLKKLSRAKSSFDLDAAYNQMYMLEDAGKDSTHVLKAIEMVENYDKSLNELRKIITDKIPEVNEEYASEILSKLDTDDALLDALETGEWTTNSAANKAINTALGDPSYKHSLWYAAANPKYTISPSRLTKIDKLGALGTSIAQLRLNAVRYAFRDPSKVRFSNKEELLKYLNTTKMTKVIQEYFPKTVPKRRALPADSPIVQEIMLNPKYAKKMDSGFIPYKIKPIPYNPKDAAKYLTSGSDKYYFRISFDETVPFDNEIYRITWIPEYTTPQIRIDDIRQAILDVYYPKENITIREYTSNLEKLSDFLNTSKMVDLPDDILRYAPDQSMFLEDLYRAFDDSQEVLDFPAGSLKITNEDLKKIVKDKKHSHTEYYGIDQLYLQRIRDEAPSTKGARRTANTDTYGQKEVAFDDTSGTKSISRPQRLNNLDKVSNISDDESTSLMAYVKSILSQVAPHIKTDEDLRYFIAPVLDYVQVVPTNTPGKLEDVRKYLSRVTGIPANNIPEHLVSDTLSRDRLGISKSTAEVVTNFQNNVFSKALSYVRKYGDYTGKYTKGAEKEYYEIRKLFGFKDNEKWLKKYGISLDPDPNGYANRLMFDALVDRKTGKFRVDVDDKFANRLALEDAAIRANLSTKLDNPKLELKDEFSDIVNKYRKEPVTVKNASEEAEAVKTTIVNESPETVAKQAYEPVSTAAETAEKTVSEMAGEMKQFADNGGSDEAGKTIYGERKWRWFKQISDALSVSSTNAFRSQRATLRTRRAKALAKRFSDFVKRYTVTGKPEDFKRFYVLRQQLVGDSVAGKDFWTEFRRSGTMTAAYRSGSKQLPIVEAALKKNAELINKAAGKPIVEVVTKEYSAGVKTVTIRFTGDTNTVKYVKKAQKALDSAKYSDVVFSPPKALTGDERAFMDSANMRELSGLMDELQSLSSDQAKLLGFNFDEITPYTRHAMNRNAGTAEWINRKFYDKLKSEDYDDISNLISNFDTYRKTDKGAFGTSLQGKRFRGDYWLLDDDVHSVFEYSPDKIFTSTLADGIFANLQYQDFTDLFINDNFKIKGWFNTVDDLKKVLYATDSKGRLSGNFANSELVSFRLDENGRISGLIKYDKTTDAGLAKALADENTILVPANAVSHMDNVLRKDIRMGNKFWSFVNKHFTIPFKFGLLSNPGFLIGNMSDSTLKLATTMCEKYGTTIEKEAANVAECINASQVLKNDFTDAFKVWKEVSAEYNIRLSPEATVPEIVAMSPKYKEDFLKWLDDSLDVPYTYENEAGILVTEYRHVPCELPKEVINNASIWTMLQGVQMSSNKLREYADLADIAPDSKFDVATNWFDRITQGSGKYDKKNFRTWGLFMNNPYMRKLTDASGGWEDIIRTASILDDLRHGQYSKEDFAKFARGSMGTEDSILYRVRLDEAKNTMFNAQFDYERQSDFISKIGKTVPFPIFFLKNFAYWMELFDKNPQFVDNAIDVQEGLWSGYNEEEDKFMTEAKGRGAVPVGGRALPEWFKGVYKPSPLQSMFGAFNLLNDPIDNLTYRVNPLISGAKTAAAEALPDNELTTLLQDPESVKYRPYSTNMYERNVKQGDPNFNPLEYTLHRMNPYERAINTYLRVPEKIKKDEFQLSDALPSVFQPMF